MLLPDQVRRVTKLRVKMSESGAAYQCINVHTTSATTENISRQEMLQWVNDSLQASYKKIEELCSGKPEQLLSVYICEVQYYSGC